MRVNRPLGDTGGADPAVTAALAAYAAGQATERATLAAIAASRLLVPVVAVMTEVGEDGAVSPEKEAEMALPTLIGNDGRKAVIAFTGTETLRRWRADARPVPVPAANLWPAVAAEQADAVVIDVAGPAQLVIEGARLAAMAVGQPPPPACDDPDIRTAIAAVTTDFALAPGGPDADLVITIKAADEAEARARAEQLARLLYPRLRRIHFHATA